MSRRYKILISAYACEPGAGSEPGMGWNWVSRLAEFHDVWLITEEQNYATAVRERIADDRPDLAQSLHVTGVHRVRYGEWLTHYMYYWTYEKWQRAALAAATQLVQKVKFDFVHQLNMIGFREPGFLWQLPLPFIWGPIGGHAQIPWNYMPSFGLAGWLRYGTRNVVNAIQMHNARRVKAAINKAKILVAATQEDQRAIQRIHGRVAHLINETGTTVSPGATPADWDGRRPLRILWSGNFIEQKAMELALRAIHRVTGELAVEFHVTGEGRCGRRWRKLARKLGIDGICRWYGMVPREQALRIMRDCDLLLFTSLKEGTPHVVAEALSYGRPVICHNVGGHGGMIDESCGIRIEMSSPEASVCAIAEALIGIRRAPERLRLMGQGALDRCAALAWHGRIARMLQLYDELAGWSARSSPVMCATSSESG